MLTMIITSPTIIANVNTQNMDTYSHTPAGNNVVEYREVDLDAAKTYCTYCNNNTNPPSECIPPSEEIPMADITLVQITMDDYKVMTVQAIRVAQEEVLIRAKSIAVDLLRN